MMGVVGPSRQVTPAPNAGVTARFPNDQSKRRNERRWASGQDVIRHPSIHLEQASIFSRPPSSAVLSSKTEREVFCPGPGKRWEAKFGWNCVLDHQRVLAPPPSKFSPPLPSHSRSRLFFFSPRHLSLSLSPAEFLREEVVVLLTAQFITLFNQTALEVRAARRRRRRSISRGLTWWEEELR